MTMSENTQDASGFIDAPIEVVRDLVDRYMASGCDCDPMQQIVAFVLAVLVERTLIASLTNSSCVQIGDCTLTLEQANTRIADLRALPLF